MFDGYAVRIERDSDGYFVASVPTLRGCHTQARTLSELAKRLREAVELCLEVQAGGARGAEFGLERGNGSPDQPSS